MNAALPPLVGAELLAEVEVVALLVANRRQVRIHRLANHPGHRSAGAPASGVQASPLVIGQIDLGPGACHIQHSIQHVGPTIRADLSVESHLSADSRAVWPIYRVFLRVKAVPSEPSDQGDKR